MCGEDELALLVKQLAIEWTQQMQLYCGNSTATEDVQDYQLAKQLSTATHDCAILLDTDHDPCMHPGRLSWIC